MGSSNLLLRQPSLLKTASVVWFSAAHGLMGRLGNATLKNLRKGISTFFKSQNMNFFYWYNKFSFFQNSKKLLLCYLCFMCRKLGRDLLTTNEEVRKN
jgi:hypothetical protein